MARGRSTTAVYWRRHFSAQAASGLNTAEYLRREGIRSNQWYRWRKILREADKVPGATLVPVKVLSGVAPAPDIRVHLPNGITVSFSEGVSPVEFVEALYCLGTE